MVDAPPGPAACGPSDAAWSPDLRRRRGILGAALSLGWLAIPIGDLLSASPGAGRLVAGLVGVTVFAALYGGVALRPRHTTVRAAATALGGMLAIAIALTLADRDSWGSLIVFVAAAAGIRLPPPHALRVILLSTALAGALMAIAGTDGGSNAAVTATTFAIGCMMLSFGRLIRSNLELIAAREELARMAVSEERLRFARDLHDLLGHSLSVIALKAELAGRLLPDRAQDAAAHVADVERVAREALAEVRDAVSGYRQPALASELEGARVALAAAGIEARLRRPATALPPDADAVLAWAVREGTTNVIRHSGARTCSISIETGDARASAEIVDDGGAEARGGARPATAGGHGLAGLRERVAGVGGRLDADPTPVGGFRLRVQVPLTATAAEVAP